ncbi:lamin tail domain-containing protein [Candidatus Woesearchaeota archaeon]|nr:lamin tail domain-containing protein [Candidatus Woesearchaeota archaeon]
MKKIIIVLLILFLVQIAFASEITLEITEFFPDPSGKDNANINNREFIEIYNYGNEEVNLSDITIKNSKNYSIDLKNYNSINQDEYLVVYPSKELSLKNSGEEKIGLYDSNILIDKVLYTYSEESFSWSKINKNWVLTNPTPGAENKAFKNEEEIKIKKITPENPLFGNTILISTEIYTAAKNSRYSIFIENLTKELRLNLKEEYQLYNLEIPLEIKSNCDYNLKEGFFLLKIKSRDNLSIKKIYIKNNEKCQKDVSSKEDKSIKTPNIKPSLANAINKTIYESKDLKQRKLVLYAFSVTLIIVIICLIIEDDRWKGNKSKGNYRGSWNSETSRRRNIE